MPINNWLIVNISFPSRCLEYGYMLGKGCICNQPPIKTLGVEPLMSFPGWEHFRNVTTHC